MNDEKPDFSNKAYLLPHINREGVRFGVVASFARASRESERRGDFVIAGVGVNVGETALCRVA